MAIGSQATTPSKPATARFAWRVAYWLLLAVWLADAVLVMNKIRAGWFTSYAADLTIPAWLYIVIRGLTGRTDRLYRLVGRTPELAAFVIFAGSASTEMSQYYWPHGLFSGRFDPLDILAYGVGVGVCYGAEKMSVGT